MIKNNFKGQILAVGFAVFVAGSVFTAVVPSSASAETAKPKTVDSCSVSILSFPTWFRGLVKVTNNECVIKSPDEMKTNTSGPSNGLSNFIWRIVLNVIEIGLRLVGYIAVGYIFYGGFLFLTSTGSSEGMTKARTTIQNAVIGLLISIASVGIVNLIMGVLG